MSYKLKVAEKDVLGKAKYVNEKGKTECVEFVRQAAGAPKTEDWRKGKKVSDAKFGEIARGTAIATFDADGKYPTDTLGKHAAIYLSHDAVCILRARSMEWPGRSKTTSNLVRPSSGHTA